MTGSAAAEAGSFIEQLLGKIQAESQERLTFLQDTYHACPGRCNDGRLYAVYKGKRISAPCWFMKDTCPYGELMVQQMRDIFAQAMVSSSMPEIHKLTFSSPQPTEALIAVRSWKFLTRPILLLLGPKGVGKSYAAAQAFARWIDSRTPSYLWKSPQLWREMAEDASRALCWMHIYRLVNERDAVDEAAKAPFLVLDDIASEDATPQAKSRVNYVISERYDNLRPTVLTGNLGIKEFIARYGERIMDRISQSGQIANCTGENLREKA